VFRTATLIPSFVAVLVTAAPAQILALRDPPKPRPSSSSVAHPPSDGAARTLALSFEDAVKRGARDECFALFDHAAMLERASKGIPATEKVKKHFRAGAGESWTADSGLVGSVLATVAGGGALRWLHVVEKDGASTAVFRLTRADTSAPEYIELVLAPHGDKGAIVVDVHSSTDAVSHARVLRRWLLALVADAGRSLPERLAGEDRAFALAGSTFESIDQAFEAGRNADALAAWATLPEALRLDPSVVLSRLRAAFASGTAAFDTALAEVRAAGRADPSIELLAIDVAMATNRPARALDALDALAQGTAVDPYLDALRGSILRDLGRREEARTASRRALEGDPRLEEAYWTLLGLAIEGERHDEALALLLRMDEHFEVDWRELAGSPAYAAFLDSKPGSRWRAKFASGR
jgi:Flp pilus assembly protein TadD